MDDQTLFDKIASSPEPLRTIDELREHLTSAFIETLNASSMEMGRSGDFGTALTINDWALRANEHAGNPLLKAHILFNCGELALQSDDKDKAEKAYREALDFYLTRENPVDILDCTAGLVTVLESRGDSTEIEEIVRRSLPVALGRPGEIPGEAARGLVMIGNVVRRQKEQPLALQCFEAVHELSIQLGDKELEAEACGQLGELRAEEEKFEEAKKYYRRAIELDGKNMNLELKALDLGNLAFVCYRQGNLEEAANLYKECLGLRERTGFQDGADIDLRHAYHVYHYLGKIQEARDLFQRFNALSADKLSFASGIKIEAYPLSLDERGRKLSGIRFG